MSALPRMVIENFRVTAALAYASRGWKVFPLAWPKVSTKGVSCSCKDGSACKNIGKHPLIDTGRNGASSDEAVIRGWWKRWPAANIGIATGPESGLAVVDVDSGKGGDSTWADLLQTYGELPATPIVDTGGGGSHYVFKHPGSYFKSGSNTLGKGVDTRGDGGYIVAAPSLHASETRYDWRVSPDEVDPADVPAWILALLADKPKPKAAERTSPATDKRFDRCEKYIAHIRAISGEGGHNATLHAACECFRFGLSRSDAYAALSRWNGSNTGGEAWTEKELNHKLDSAYAKVSSDNEIGVRLKQDDKFKPRTYTLPPPAVAHEDDMPPEDEVDPATELHTYLNDVVSGKVFNAEWPWPITTRMTQALLPGSVVTICGDPGVGKTFYVLQCALFWLANDISHAINFIEKNRRFHMMRLLAQLEGDGRFVDYPWLAKNADAIAGAMERNREMISRVGKSLTSSTENRATLKTILEWITRQAESGKRVIVVDPITAASAGAERWSSDDDFMIGAQQVMSDCGSSLVLITHPKKGNQNGKSSGHDAAGGAAYFRFCDTLMWLHRPKKPRSVIVKGNADDAIPQKLTPDVFFQFHKTRDGKGAGLEVAASFGQGLKFIERGLVLKEARDNGAEEVIP